MTLLRLGGRDSPLSQLQCREVIEALEGALGEEIPWEGVFVPSEGDRQRHRSLKEEGEHSLFTDCVNRLLLEGTCDVTIHSAKDLPLPLEEGLSLLALTSSIDPRDALVLPPHQKLSTLLPGTLIGSSSRRRDRTLTRLRPDLIPIEVRGRIGERLALLERGVIGGLIVAEAALLRLGLTGLNRLLLPGESTPHQGQLAIVAREGNSAMQRLFAPLDSRSSLPLIHTGVRPSPGALHWPLIRLQDQLPKGYQGEAIKRLLTEVSHLLVTSQNGARFMMEWMEEEALDPHAFSWIAIGPTTASTLMERGITPSLIPEEATQEGLLKALLREDLAALSLFIPHAAGSRPHLMERLSQWGVRYWSAIFYTTHFTEQPLPTLTSPHHLLLKSPSAVAAWHARYPQPPPHIHLKALGPITSLAHRRHAHPSLALPCQSKEKIEPR
ncbi:MAG: uroporphyrinogen-III synthase [Chlamydiota bacterium]|nr:uroporphyrinogen-III synthase [Chlamydiota bacterium]